MSAFTYDLNALPAAVMGEPTKIRQVVTNLLSNAVKYTAQGRVGLAVTARSARRT